MGDDCLRTVNALRALGIRIDEPEPDTIVVHGKRRVLNAPTDEIDCGNSATTMRADGGITRWPNIRKPADWRCFAFQASNGARHRAVAADGRKHYGGRSRRHSAPVHSWWVVAWNSLRNGNPKCAGEKRSLLAGLFAKGKTSIVEEIQTRDHTERMLRYFFVRTTREENGTISIFGDQVPESARLPHSGRSFLRYLLARRCGGAARRPPPRSPRRFEYHAHPGARRARANGRASCGKQLKMSTNSNRTGSLEVTGAMLKGTVIQGKEVAQLIDELPVLAVAGALANGTTIIRQAQELRVKETDRIAAIAHNLRVMGAQVIELSDGLEIHGPAPLRGGRVASLVIIASPWHLPSPDSSQMAKPSCRRPNARKFPTRFQKARSKDS